MRKKLREYIRSLDSPGVLVSMRSSTYGYWNLNVGTDKITTTMQFPVGSVTKTFTGTAILQLYDQGVIQDLDAPISSVYLGVPNGERISIRHVGSMRSGLFNYTEGVNDIIDNNITREWSVGELLLSGLTFAPYFPPGTSFHYSNTNTVILGEVLERLYDKPVNQIFKERIFDPVGLTSTYFGDLRGGNYITGYVYKNGEYVPVDWSNRSWAFTAGEIVSTVEDMHIYAKKSIAQHVTLSRNAVRQQRNWQSDIQLQYGLVENYGFQMAKIGRYLGHNGSTPGCTCSVFASEQSKTTFVIVAAAQFSPNGVELARSIAIYLISLLEKDEEESGRIC